MRLLLVSTPRSGNTWFRRLLSGCLNLAEAAAHAPGDLDWHALPDRCIVQLHSLRTPEVLAICARHGFQPVLILRHPLDVLLSILHFCAFEPATALWLSGQGGDETDIKNRTPADETFLDYALSERAALLLRISSEWVAADVPSVRYEHLVEQTESTLEQLLKRNGWEPLQPLSEVINRNVIDLARAGSSNQHFWHGRPGLWRSLICREAAVRIYSAHQNIFEALGYGVDASIDLRPTEVVRRWHALG